VWVGHVVLESGRLEESAAFMRSIGLRPVFQGPAVAVFELRGGTHLLILPKGTSGAAGGSDLPFDLMVDDLQATHRRFIALGLDPTPIETVPNIDHERFRVREPSGRLITFFSSHVAGRPV